MTFLIVYANQQAGEIARKKKDYVPRTKNACLLEKSAMEDVIVQMALTKRDVVQVNLFDLTYIVNRLTILLLY